MPRRNYKPKRYSGRPTRRTTTAEEAEVIPFRRRQREPFMSEPLRLATIHELEALRDRFMK